MNGIETSGGAPYLNAYPADFILLHIGTNDILNEEGTSAATVSQILDEIDAWEDANDLPVTVFVARIINVSPTPNANITTFNTNVSNMVAGRVDPSIIMVNMESGAGIVLVI